MQNQYQAHPKKDGGWGDVARMLRPSASGDAIVRNLLLLAGFFTGFVTVLGALWGYRRAYDRRFQGTEVLPLLSPLHPVLRRAMILGGVIAAVIWFFALKVIVGYVNRMEANKGTAYFLAFLIGTGLNFAAMVWFFSKLDKWRSDIFMLADEQKRFGTAKFAAEEELQDLTQNNGLYIGGQYYYSQQGHLLTVAGTRGGKGVNLIIPNLLGKGNYTGSWVVIDPKGENAFISARYQRERGQRVLVLDPWDIVTNQEKASYNPLDLLDPNNTASLVDDAGIIAEMIIPAGSSDFFRDRARSILTGLITHLVIAQEAEDHSLATIWSWLRLQPQQWNDLIGDLCASDNATVRATGNELISLMNSQATYASVMATVLQFTDFLKSPPLQASLQRSSFNAKDLSVGNVTLYVVIPADKLKSHYQWLRLVVTTALRSVVRNPGRRVTFLLDEFAALGHLSEIEVALSTYAGYNVTIWAILQNLVQLNDLYGNNWQTFLGNTAVRQYFSIGDNFTADYVSKAMGQTTYLSEHMPVGQRATARPLLTPDELSRGSKANIFALIEQRAPTFFEKIPYWTMPDLNGRWDDNPYVTGVFPNR